MHNSPIDLTIPLLVDFSDSPIPDAPVSATVPVTPSPLPATDSITIPRHVPRALRELDTFYNPILPQHIQPTFQSGREEQADRTPIPPTPINIDRGDQGSQVFDVEEADPNLELAEIAAMLIEQLPEFNEPTFFDEAWSHSDPTQRQNWRNAINKEFAEMESRQVWKVINRSEMPKDRRCVKSKWVFKIKRDNTF